MKQQMKGKLGTRVRVPGLCCDEINKTDVSLRQAEGMRTEMRVRRNFTFSEPSDGWRESSGGGSVCVCVCAGVCLYTQVCA